MQSERILVSDSLAETLWRLEEVRSFLSEFARLEKGLVQAQGRSEIECRRAEVEATKRENEELRKKADIRIALSDAEGVLDPTMKRLTLQLSCKS